MTLNQLVQKLKQIKEMGFIPTTRAHQGGVGNTLENQLDIKENNLHLPDIGRIEIKAKRIDSQSMLTLSSKAPLPRGVNRVLFESYKRKDPETGYYKFYSTVGGKLKNVRGFKVKLIGDKLVLENPKKIEVYWPLLQLNDVMKTDQEYILLVLAETRGGLGKSDEKFHYKEAYLLSGMDFTKIKSAIPSGHLKVDIRIGVDLTGKRAGKYHDHGTGFRVLKNDYLKLFNLSKQLI